MTGNRDKILRPVGPGHLDRTLRDISKVLDSAIFSARPRHYRFLSAKWRIILVLFFLVSVSFASTFSTMICLSLFSFINVAISIMRNKFSLRDFLFSGFIIALVFVFVLSTPALLNVFSHHQAKVLFPIWHFSRSFYLGPIFVPEIVGVTSAGIFSASMLILRVSSSIAMVLWATLSTHWFDLLRGLRQLKVPREVIQIMGMMLIFLHMFLRRAEEMYLGKKSRMICRAGVKSEQRWIGRRIAYLWHQSYWMMEEVYQAMSARGFRGD